MHQRNCSRVDVLSNIKHLCLIEASEMMEYSIPQPGSQTSQHFVQKGIGMENIGMTATIILALKYPCCNCQLLLDTVAIILKSTLRKAICHYGFNTHDLACFSWIAVLIFAWLCFSYACFDSESTTLRPTAVKYKHGMHGMLPRHEAKFDSSVQIKGGWLFWIPTGDNGRHCLTSFHPA
eukprot:TsM_000368400 transcript=TsM_000368400 gene=TsM_000368400